MILASHGIIGSQIVQFSGLLDTYTGAAAAYSLRLLRSAYTGYAIKVRRASDNTEQDIGFSNNELDTTSLASFCSGTNGFVTTWYDQSGNGRNATQTTAASQPKIYDSSTGVITENGKAAVQFDGSDDFFDTNNFSSITCIFIYSINNNVNNQFCSNNANSDYIFTSQTQLSFDGNLSDEAKYSTNGSAFSGFAENHIISISLNTQYLTTGVYDVSQGYETQIERLGKNNNTNYDGNMQELIFYNSDQSSNRTGIETNINDFYSIY